MSNQGFRKLIQLSKQKTFLLMAYVGKKIYFEVAPPGHTIAFNKH